MKYAYLIGGILDDQIIEYETGQNMFQLYPDYIQFNNSCGGGIVKRYKGKKVKLKCIYIHESILDKKQVKNG